MNKRFKYINGRREYEEIMDSREILDLYSYIYIYYLSNLLIFLLNNVHYTIVCWVNRLLYSLCLIVCIVSGSVAMAIRNHSINGTHTRSGHKKTTLGIGLRPRTRMNSVSPRYILFACNMYRHHVSLASFVYNCYTCIKPEEKVVY